MRKNLGEKVKKLSNQNRDQILNTYLSFEENEISKIFNNNEFCCTKVQVEQPLVENGKFVTLKNGKIKPDVKLRDYEKIPLNVSIDDYFKEEVKPYLPDSWMDRTKDKIGYEINFNKYFYKFSPIRSSSEVLEEIQKITIDLDEDLKKL